MKNMKLVAIAAAAGMIGAVAATLAISRPAGGDARSPGNLVLARQLDIELGRVKAPPWMQHVSSGVMYDLLEASGILASRADQVREETAAPLLPSTAGVQGCKNTFTASGIPNNYRVNQDCSRRR